MERNPALRPNWRRSGRAFADASRLGWTVRVCGGAVGERRREVRVKAGAGMPVLATISATVCPPIVSWVGVGELRGGDQLIGRFRENLCSLGNDRLLPQPARHHRTVVSATTGRPASEPGEISGHG